ncbi:catalase [Capsaspora owczarzaki ATCC 30864]|uniref:Catalase n=1 Tax=Capsaspora owczarzaki (strain ATCC 30864) TaxID=595528 RepID=A0A0D2X136_CAPO3|nr:catalase [Capsaspora owczarzaki ATCC 30864]KJE90124.1 catalase [Capsaspora owczarzaki ATCC 30864]|eukprot:XP_004364341.1 catalase [Capsaspora owczarzaki ATCC 30864]
MSRLTTSNGTPVVDNQNSLSAGETGPLLLQDFHFIDKLAHFDRERIPERVVHAKGAGAHGYFEVTKDVSHLCKAKFLERVGKRTPLFTRFSTVGGEKGSADTARDPRGFAVKFYTEEGNWDMVGNNTPIFFIRDPIKFPDFIHTQKRNPQTNLPDADMFWDFLSQTPESCHQVSILFSSRGTPDGYRHMHGFSSHTLKMVNAKGAQNFVKFHFKTEQGVKNLTPEQANKLKAENPDYATQDLFDSIEKGNYPSWKVCIQVMPLADVPKQAFNPFDVTKVWSQKAYPLQEIGRMVLNRNPENYFAEVEQAAFSPSHMVPGIEPSPDKMLQGRLFSYPDTHRHRLGANYLQIPVNCPYAARVSNHQRDGFMAINGNGGKLPNYEPSSFGGPKEDKTTTDASPYEVSGTVGHHPPAWKNQDDFKQAGDLYRLLSAEEKTALVNNIVGHLSGAKKHLQKRQVEIFRKCDSDYGARIEQGLLKSSSAL